MSFNPNWVSIPGDTIKSILEFKGSNIIEFSEKINKPSSFIENLIKGYVSIDNELAEALSEQLGFDKEFWLKREENYRTKLVELEKEWISNLPIRSMQKLGLLPLVNKDKIVNSCLHFFGVNTLDEWNKNYRNQISQFAFRKSPTFKTSPYSISVWFRQAENFIKKIKVGNWDKVIFESKLSEIKLLTREKKPIVFIPQLIKLCAECGVYVAIVRGLEGNPASGATKFINGNPLIILSFRYLTDDHFWFTFFHEAGHLILHGEKKLWLELDSNINENEEYEANLFAQACLIPHELENRLQYISRNKRSIIKISMDAQISPGILIGQLQHRGFISKSYMNGYKRYYTKDSINEAIHKVQEIFNH
ncbi:MULTISPECIES: ImmA/IrrE family metallo-endopeptidase [unclassified Sphingobacterium]|uniref:ImmA/IrrE family metallo-endopeptidase n=1 Tax=unclassified Sphingobacterium TaxID=2609468 RepID=UPI0020C29706|nr:MULTISPECIES: ImmA/IrrE family metallo-endopeptidase [unclassified Sphingobacterium]